MNRLEKWLLTILFFELFAGGGGRQIEFGPISIRQLLFILLLVSYGSRLISNRETRVELKELLINKNLVAILSISLLIWIGVSTLIGIINGHQLGEVIKDSLRVSYIILIFPFWTYIRTDRFPIEKVISVLKIATLAVSIGTIIIGLCGKYFFVNDFKYFYQFINELLPADLFFRPSRGVFYKSHFIVLFGLILSSNNFISNRVKKIDMAILILASVSIIYSETRGLYIGYLLALLAILLTNGFIYYFAKAKGRKVSKKNKKLIVPVIFYLCAFTIVPTLYNSSTQSRFNDSIDQSNIFESNKKTTSKTGGGSKQVNDVSVNMRVYLFEESAKIIKKSSTNAIIGNGYGSVIGSRTDGIEMTFLDILVEQGIIGVLLWLGFSLLPAFYYLAYIFRHSDLDSTSVALLACVLTMIVITNINPFLNSPIGLGFLLPVIISAKRLEIEKERVALYQNNSH